MTSSARTAAAMSSLVGAAIIARAISLRTPAPKPTPGTTDPFQEDPMDRLIVACFRKFIGRDPSDGEVDNWLVLAATGGFDSKGVAVRIAASPEAQAHAAGK